MTMRDETPEALLNEKIKRLRHAWAIETNPAEKLKLEEQINEAERNFAACQPRRHRLVLGLAILIALLGMFAIGYYYYYSRAPRPQPDSVQQPGAPQAQPATPAATYNNTTTLAPIIHNSATTEGDQSPAIVGDGATVNY